jgi:hypothetical protein
MTNQCVNWKPVKSINVDGGVYLNSEFPHMVEVGYRGTLLPKILSMPIKNPVSFETAVNLACDKWNDAISAGRIGYEPGECNWYYKNFVEWISELGFHIELTGDEFEGYAMSDKVA